MKKIIDKERINLKYGQGVMGWVAEKGKLVNIGDVSQDKRYLNIRNETKSEIVVPLIRSEKVVGLFNLEADEINAFSKRDEKILRIIAEHTAIAIENAKLYERERTLQKINNEILVAKDIQQKFLPRFIPEIDKLDIFYYFKAAFHVGGDCIDLIKLNNHKLLFYIADVSGKGIPAALIASNLQATMELVLEITSSKKDVYLEKIVFMLNNLFFKRMELSFYLTMFIGVIDTEKGIFEYVNAGHEWPLFYKKNKKVILDKSDLVIGFRPDTEYTAYKEAISKDDLLLVATDGLKDGSRDGFYPDEIFDIIENMKSNKPKEIGKSILKEFQSTKTYIKDDITFILLKLI